MNALHTPQDSPADCACALAIDCAAANVDDQVLAAASAETQRFRGLAFANRAPKGQIRTVAFHYWRYGIGGAEKVTYALMGLFRSLGHAVVLYTDEPAQPGDYGLPEGVVRKTVPTSGERERAAFWRREAAETPIDAMVYSSWLSPWAVVDCLSLQAAGAVLLYHTHGISTYFIGSDLGADYLERTAKLAMAADAVVTLSEADRLFWSALSPCVEVAVNPVSLYLPDPPERTVPDGATVLFCGRLDPLEKRPECALRIFARVARDMPEARMRFVGGGAPEEAARLERLSRELGLEDRVAFLGFQDDPAFFMRDSNVLVMTSPSEGFPLTLTEACCLGLPAVMFELPHLPIACGNEGIVQVPQDDEEAAARAIALVLSDAARQKRMGAKTQEAYRRVCCIDHAAAWRATLARALEARNSPRGVPAPNASPQSAFVHLIIAGYGREIERVRRIQEREQAAHRRAEELEHDLSCVTSSVSFRLGRAITGIPRRLRDALRKLARRH